MLMPSTSSHRRAYNPCPARGMSVLSATVKNQETFSWLLLFLEFQNCAKREEMVFDEKNWKEWLLDLSWSGAAKSLKF